MMQSGINNVSIAKHLVKSMFQIRIAKIPYTNKPNCSKCRPVLILGAISRRRIAIFRITSRYWSKPKYFRQCYSPITNWRESHLKKPSYIDTNTVFIIKRNILTGKHGCLTIHDCDKLIGNIKKMLRLNRGGIWDASVRKKITTAPSTPINPSLTSAGLAYGA